MWNNLDLKEPLEVSEQVWRRSGCLRLCPIEFGVSPRMGGPQPLWHPFSSPGHPHGENAFPRSKWNFPSFASHPSTLHLEMSLVSSSIYPP